MPSTLSNYVSVQTGNRLVVKSRMFHWRGRFFTGLVDVEANALYDNPDDSFAAHVGVAPSSLGQGLIERRSHDESPAP